MGHIFQCAPGLSANGHDKTAKLAFEGTQKHDLLKTPQQPGQNPPVTNIIAKIQNTSIEKENGRAFIEPMNGHTSIEPMNGHRIENGENSFQNAQQLGEIKMNPADGGIPAGRSGGPAAPPDRRTSMTRQHYTSDGNAHKRDGPRNRRKRRLRTN